MINNYKLIMTLLNMFYRYSSTLIVEFSFEILPHLEVYFFQNDNFLFAFLKCEDFCSISSQESDSANGSLVGSSISNENVEIVWPGESL